MRIFIVALVLGTAAAILLWCAWAELRDAVTRLRLRVLPVRYLPEHGQFPKSPVKWGKSGLGSFGGPAFYDRDDAPHWAESDHFDCGDK